MDGVMASSYFLVEFASEILIFCHLHGFNQEKKV